MSAQVVKFHRGHSFVTPPKVRITYCDFCGLIPLNNGISRLCARLGCEYREHPQFQAWVRGGRKPLAESV